MKNLFKYVWRTFFVVFLILVAIHAIAALTYDRHTRYSEISFVSAKITPELEGYVIAFVTDTHELPEAKLQAIAANINARGANLLLLGGDYHEHAFAGTMAILGNIKTPDGVFGVDGNHDEALALFAAMRANGITPLDNEGFELKPGLHLAGVADLWNRGPNIAKAVASRKPHDFVLLVAHNPDVSMLQSTTGVDLILSGHTHGGEMTFFGLWAPALAIKPVTDYGQKFRAGWAANDQDTVVYVSRGTGLRKRKGLPFLWPRVFAPPEVVFLTLKSTPE